MPLFSVRIQQYSWAMSPQSQVVRNIPPYSTMAMSKTQMLQIGRDFVNILCIGVSKGTFHFLCGLKVIKSLTSLRTEQSFNPILSIKKTSLQRHTFSVLAHLNQRFYGSLQDGCLSVIVSALLIRCDSFNIFPQT